MSKHSVASIAALLGEPSRAAMLLALLDGRALPAGELARIAKLSAAATSLHLAKLTQGGVLSVRSEGRHRYYRLASAQVAYALEALGAIATHPVPASATALSAERAALRHARSCYDHLAGVLSVELTQAFEREQLLVVEDDRNYTLTPHGADWFGAYLDIDVDLLAAGRRVLARRCLDWTERRPHLAGALGAALLSALIDRSWLRRVGSTRQLRLTQRGRAGLARSKLGLSLQLGA